MGTPGILKILAALAVLAALAGSSSAGWEVKKSVDALDSTKSRAYVFAESKQPIQQFDHNVRVWLVVTCEKVMGPGPAHRDINRLFAKLSFAETVAIGERWIRWRIDEHEVRKKKSRFYGDGKDFYLSTTIGQDDVTEQIVDAMTMRVEADLPWAGKAILEFDISNGPATFAQIPCENKAMRQKSQ